VWSSVAQSRLQYVCVLEEGEHSAGEAALEEEREGLGGVGLNVADELERFNEEAA
jgi:hypothetical protein